MTRVREPLDYYLSFFRWGVAFRQKENPSSFGSNFIEWVSKVPNLQSTMMVQSMAAMAAEYHLPQYRMYYTSNAILGKNVAERQKKLETFLDSFAIVAPMHRFDESLLLAHDMTGLPVTLYRRNRPNQKGGFRGKNADVCPDMEACRKAVQAVAERDHWMYDKYSAAFEAKLKGLGDDFARRVRLYKEAVANVQDTWKGVPRKQFICRYHPETTVNQPNLKLPNLRCPLRNALQTGPQASLCQSIYAHRLFECPWQYVPNSTLSDGLGCWRPSSGFK